MSIASVITSITFNAAINIIIVKVNIPCVIGK